MSKLKLSIKATVIVELDGAYYANDNMEKIEELIQDKIRSMSVLIQEGTTTPKACPANIKLSRIVYELDS